MAGNCVGIKAKTPEGTGTDNAAIAHAVVLLESIPLEPLLEEDAVAVGVQEQEEEVTQIIDGGNGNGQSFVTLGQNRRIEGGL